MFVRFLDRFEEAFISLLMVAAVLLIFVAVCQRYSVSLLADLVSWSRANGHESLMGMARSTYRSVAGINLLWAQELCIYLFVWMAKFGAAYGVRVGIHVGVDVLVNAVGPRWQRLLVTVSLASGVLFTAIVAWIGGHFVYGIAQTAQVTADLEMPVWIVYLAVPAGSLLMCFRFLQAMVHYLRTGEIAHHEPAADLIAETEQGLSENQGARA
ncbi:TRAP transporter small permease [Alcaligenes sp. SDU_A2]|uniref:TRAP transporter small permease n=1 Tax=Alcaligenes sp. SDU_A2 TaxID=3136634 RepID=UPI002BFE0360|nr:TRAP transporter small permease [Alcaligenes sp.]HRL27938.1 TRAP transporter small permease [Alcaligenes sp.]